MLVSLKLTQKIVKVNHTSHPKLRQVTQPDGVVNKGETIVPDTTLTYRYHILVTFLCS